MKPEPTTRIPSYAGWTDGRRLALCRCGCGQAPQHPRRTFATDACVTAWKIRTNPGFAREQVWRRDLGVCAACGQACRPLRGAKHRLWSTSSAVQRQAALRSPLLPEWHADHIVPVAEGGADLGLANLRTLCRPCHVHVTRALRARLAAGRRAKGAPAP